ncbi:2-haloalkanoic acid dehalogenase [Petrocella atlantisensis]|uniref:2-haloalkanoic acid dehalogenase n=1 Tax=Petrocella atlantisensis TaxID=2173034 RepID=A0A3P7S3D1_9FIRM|nr:HAD-IA family hydrolase [Petrocella atlantisensis]VDN49122.1 2-haloalkanoic acid dehalogenase [Petrocella atlantisensis]
MRRYQTMLFDLDDTLLDRDKAVDRMFSIILENCYGEVRESAKSDMLQKFKEYDNGGGYSNKVEIFESFFNVFPPKYRLQGNNIMDFWNNNFPSCFSLKQNTINIVNSIKVHVKVGIITNGITQRQKEKIVNTNLDRCFDIIIISDEVGYSKPDKRIFKLALNKLDVQPETALFVGDNIEKDIGGCQNANINGIWFNPRKVINDTMIKPYAEISSLEELLVYFT